MRLTADKLELYDLTGKGEAANSISSAVTHGTKFAIRKIGRKYSEDKAVAVILEVWNRFIYPVLSVYARYGARDTEPRTAIKSEIVNRIAERYGLDDFENDSLLCRI